MTLPIADDAITNTFSITNKVRVLVQAKPFLILPANIRLGWKDWQGTKTYFISSPQICLSLSIVVNLIKTFFFVNDKESKQSQLLSLASFSACNNICG
jgi:hypothetical protein